MKRWLTLGGLLMLGAWGPYLLAELHSAPAEKRSKTIVEQQAPDAPTTAAAGSSADVGRVSTLGAEAVAHAARPEPVHPEPVAKPSPPAPAEPLVPEPPASDAPDAPEATADEAHPHVEPPSAFGQTEVLKHAYDTQPRDPLWATDAESKIGGLFASKDMPAGMLQGASCRRAVCRIELNWSSEHAAAFLKVYQGVIQEFGTDLAMQPLPAEEGAVNQRLDLYLTRKGYTVADLSK